MTPDEIQLQRIEDIVRSVTPEARCMIFGGKVVCTVRPSRWPSEVTFDLHGLTMQMIRGHAAELDRLTRGL